MGTTCVSQLQLNDDKLISLGRRGDRDALHTLFTRYRRLLHGLAFRVLHNHDEAEDAVQNCLVQAFRNLECVRCTGAFRSWLVRILVNEALAIIHNRKSLPTTASPQHSSEKQGVSPERFPAPGPDPGQELARKECVAALMTHLACLPARLRSAVLLCDIGEHTIEEASAVLGLAPNTLRVRLHRARTKLGLAMRRRSRRVNLPDALIGV